MNSRRAEEKRRLEAGQKLREERLRELEAEYKMIKGKPFFKSKEKQQIKKEIELLRKKIKAYKRRKTIRAVVPVLAIILIVSLVFAGVDSDKADNTNTESSTKMIAANVSVKENILQNETFEIDSLDNIVNSPDVAADEIQQTENKNIKNDDNAVVLAETEAVEAEEAETENLSSNEEVPDVLSLEATEPEEVVEPVPEATAPVEPSLIKLTADDISVSTTTDYGHINTSSCYLGNGEGVTVTVETSVSGISYDDIILQYDENLLTVKEMGPYEASGKIHLRYYVTGNKQGTSELSIITVYDLLSDDENVFGYTLNIRKLDEYYGRVCYVTRNGEKYHLSEKCPGENAIKTTYYDASANGLEPCKKCAKNG